MSDSISTVGLHRLISAIAKLDAMDLKDIPSDVHLELALAHTFLAMVPAKVVPQLPVLAAVECPVCGEWANVEHFSLKPAPHYVARIEPHDDGARVFVRVGQPDKDLAAIGRGCEEFDRLAALLPPLP